ncbi:MAG TPA: sugar phosphate nucleotidyltransferase [Propionibacteriaceae bacterium]|nr:sugar phosphate nucleotidyltransferase [Propionibacteriaceae bacterium]
MTRGRILALIQAGGKGSRMDVLTRESPKPVLPFAGEFRLIDFPLSNLRNSDIDDVWLSVQYQALAVANAVGNGKPWDLDRHSGGFRLLMPQQGGGSSLDDGFVRGNAEELLQSRDLFRRHGCEFLVVMSSDHVYRLDFAKVVQEHIERGAECTMVTTEVDLAEATNHATVTTDDTGRVTDFAYKPSEPSTGTISTEVFVYTAEVLIEVLEQLQRELFGTRDSDPSASLGDFGDYLIPAMVDRGKVYATPQPGYWCDLGRPETYVLAHRDLLHTDVDLFEADWPISTNTPQRVPARLRGDAHVSESLISGGCHIEGRVSNSVLGPGVVVAEGAEIRDSIVFADVVVGAGATLDWAILDTGVRVEADAVVGGANPDNEVSEERLTLIGRDCHIVSGSTVPAGSRLEPGSSS